MTESQTFPGVSIETPRLLLRPYRGEDAPDVALACRDELTQRWLPLPTPYTDADALAWCTEMAPRFRASGEGIEWAAIRRADDRLIGSFGLKRTDWRARSSEIGYWVAPWARGHGLAVETVVAIGRWLLVEQRFERLVLRAATDNRASQRVAEKAGLTREGIARNAGFTNAGRVDLVVFSLVAGELGADVADAVAEQTSDDVERIRAWYRALPAKRVGAGVLSVDDRNHVLLVKPTYKERWEIPGGLVEASESPHEAAAREVAEELGIDRTLGRLLCVDWVPARDPKTDGLMFIFDGGLLGPIELANVALPSEELSEYRFVAPLALGQFLPEHMARRVAAALAARDVGTTDYLVDGRPLNDGGLSSGTSRP